MAMHMAVQCRTEAVDKADRPEPRARVGPRIGLPQMALDRAQEDREHGTERPGFALQVPAQALGHREDPLAHRQRREDVVDQVRGGLRHAPGGAGGAQSPALAGEGDQEVVTAGHAAGTGKAVGEDAALADTRPGAVNVSEVGAWLIGAGTLEQRPRQQLQYLPDRHHQEDERQAGETGHHRDLQDLLLAEGEDLHLPDHAEAVAQVGQGLDVGAAQEGLVRWRRTRHPLLVEGAVIVVGQEAVLAEPLPPGAGQQGGENQQGTQNE